MPNGNSLVHGGDDLSLEAARRRHVEQVLAIVGGIKSRAARLLGVSRMRLDEMITRYGLHDIKPPEQIGLEPIPNTMNQL